MHRILCITSAITRSKRIASTFTIPEGATALDASWRSSNGGSVGPWYIASAGDYYLTDSPVADLTAFVLQADNINLYMPSNKTITFLNATNSQPITNGDFESGSTGWDLTGAAGASVKTDAAYIDRECWTGNTSLEITIPASTTYTIETSDSKTVGDGESWALTFWHSLATTNVTLTASIGATDLALSYGSTRPGTFACGLIQPSGSSESGPIVITIQNNSATTAYTFQIDRVMFARSRYHGIICGTNLAAGTQAPIFPGVTTGTTPADNFSLYADTGAAIIQGQGSYDSSCILMRSATGRHYEGPVEIRQHTDSIGSDWGYGIHNIFGDSYYKNLIINGQNTGIRNRDQQEGYAIDASNQSGTVVFDGLVFQGAPQGGVRQISNASGSITIQNCSGGVKARYTNGFLYTLRQIAGTTSIAITNNTHDFTADASLGCRWLHLDGPTCTGGILVHGNVVKVRELLLNQEYSSATGGPTLHGTYIVQVEGQATGLQCYNNVFHVIGSGGGDLMRLKATNTASTMDVYIHDETYVVNLDSFAYEPGCIWSIKFSDCDQITIENIDMTTNDMITGIDEGNIGTLLINGGTLAYVNDGSTRKAHYREWLGEGTVEYRDIDYADAATVTYMKSGWELLQSGGTAGLTALVKLTETCTLTFQNGAAVPQVGLSITVKDQFGTTINTGTTDSNGQITDVVEWYRTSIADSVVTESSTDRNPLSVETNYGGGTVHSWTLDQTTRTKTFDVDNPV